MRAILQGLDERESYGRYLHHGVDPVDLRTVRGTIQWIRDEFAATAQRKARPGTARLVLMDPERFDAPPMLPSLEEFAAACGMEDFSEQEQAEAYAEAYPAISPSGRSASNGKVRQRPPHRARVIARQLDALRWLEEEVEREPAGPAPQDKISAWLNPRIASRLERVGLVTLDMLAAHINATGPRWWRTVPGVGALKALRVVDWLDVHSAAGDLKTLKIAAHAAKARKDTAQAVLDAVVPAAVALLPFEKLVVPESLDGHAGNFRAPISECRIPAHNDHEAIACWLAAKSGEMRPQSNRLAREEGRQDGRRGDPPRLSATQRAYRKEAERLLLWCVLEQKKPISSLSVDDALAYQDFLAAPPDHWCGPRHCQRWTPSWRPLEGALSAVAQRHAMTVLSALFGFLCNERYLTSNPFAAVVKRETFRLAKEPVRALTAAEWEGVQLKLREIETAVAGRRLVRAMRWLYGTDLQLSELVRARCGDLRRQEAPDGPGTARSVWQISVFRVRQLHTVNVPSQLVADLVSELANAGRSVDFTAADTNKLPLLAPLAPGAPETGWSASGLYKAIRAGLHRLSLDGDSLEATVLRKISARTLRRSRTTHALQMMLDSTSSRSPSRAREHVLEKVGQSKYPSLSDKVSLESVV